jgi:hypothetical protein
LLDIAVMASPKQIPAIKPAMKPNTFFFLLRMREGSTPESKIGVACTLVDLLQRDIEVHLTKGANRH